MTADIVFMTTPVRIAVIGLGYVGLPNALVIASP
ncbi:MAG: hypothetical protein LAC69_08580 [Chlorobium sp.]|nr:hypothetical protein [Chlorobium sp.]